MQTDFWKSANFPSFYGRVIVYRSSSSPFDRVRRDMSASPNPLASPPPRQPPADRAQTRSSGPASSPCVLCSPPAREECLRSPLDGSRNVTEDPVALIVESWCSPTLVSPAGRPCSVMQLEAKQAAGPVDIADPYLEEEQWDMEAMVLSTIAGQLDPRRRRGGGGGGGTGSSGPG